MSIHEVLAGYKIPKLHFSQNFVDIVPLSSSTEYLYEYVYNVLKFTEHHYDHNWVVLPLSMSWNKSWYLYFRIISSIINIFLVHWLFPSSVISYMYLSSLSIFSIIIFHLVFLNHVIFCNFIKPIPSAPGYKLRHIYCYSCFHGWMLSWYFYFSLPLLNFVSLLSISLSSLIVFESLLFFLWVVKMRFILFAISLRLSTSTSQ